MADKIHEALAAIDGTFRKTEMVPMLTNELPDGTYQCVIENTRIEVSKNSGRLQIAWPLRVLNGEKKNSVITKYDGLADEKNFGYVKQTLSKLGLPEAASAFALKDIVIKADGIKVEIVVKTKDQFCNIYFGKLLKAEDVAPQRQML